MNTALLDNSCAKKTEAEVMEEPVNLLYKGGNVKEFFVKANKLHKKARFNDQAKFGFIREAIKRSRYVTVCVLREERYVREI